MSRIALTTTRLRAIAEVLQASRRDVDRNRQTGFYCVHHEDIDGAVLWAKCLLAERTVEMADRVVKTFRAYDLFSQNQTWGCSYVRAVAREENEWEHIALVWKVGDVEFEIVYRASYLLPMLTGERHNSIIEDATKQVGGIKGWWAPPGNRVE